MKLHLDKKSFKVLIDNIHKRTGYRSDVLEKDYYVVLILKELSLFQKEGLKAYFKGGTALYKALKTTNRFSEDIDLSVDTRGLSRTQSDKMLEKATKKYINLLRNKELGFTHKSEIVSFYMYEPVTNFDKDDELQRFGNVKIEATSFTISEPVNDLEVTPLIYELATDEERLILKEKYDVYSFNIKTITLERIFVDKLFAAEAYSRKSHDPHRAFEAAKHIYDLTVLEINEKIDNLFLNQSLLQSLLEIRLEEEKERLDGIPNVLPKDFLFFDSIAYDKNIISAYSIMQRQYVLKDDYKINFNVVVESIKRIKEKLFLNSSWKIDILK